jgi:protein regulator of cytokinesis 1
LTIHEDEIRRLKEERRNKAPLLASVKKYFEICEEEKELAAAASDQSRLTGRGPRDPGRLLREEKMRKRVTKEKPRVSSFRFNLVLWSQGTSQLEQDLLNSIPAWEQEMRKSFLVHGEPFLPLLMGSIGASDQENKRKPPRAGSVPPRATTPVNSTHGYMPVTKSGNVVIPAVRTISQVTGSGSQSVPNKRQKLGDHAPTARVPLGGYKGVNIASANARAASPTKLPTKTPSTMSLTSSSRSAAIGMVVPKPGTQHHALGHGRMPTSVIYGAGVSGVPSGGYVPGASMRSVSSSTTGYGRSTSSRSQGPAPTKSSRVMRESFKPRPSVECALDARINAAVSVGGKRQWDRFMVREEDEY